MGREAGSGSCLVSSLGEKSNSCAWMNSRESTGGVRALAFYLFVLFILHTQVTGSTQCPRRRAPLQSSPLLREGSTPSLTLITARPGRGAGRAPSATPPSRPGRRFLATPASPPTHHWTAPKSKTTSSSPCWPASAQSGPSTLLDLSTPSW